MYIKEHSFVLIFVLPLKQHKPSREFCSPNTMKTNQEATSDFSCSRTTSHQRDDARFILTSSEIWQFRFAATAQWPEPLWQCKSPQIQRAQGRARTGSSEPEEQSCSNLLVLLRWHEFPQETENYSHWMQYLLQLLCFFFFFFWCKAGTFPVFSNIGCYLLQAISLCIYESALSASPSSLLYQKGLSLNTALGEREKGTVMHEGSWEQCVFSKKENGKHLNKGPKRQDEISSYLQKTKYFTGVKSFLLLCHDYYY